MQVSTPPMVMHLGRARAPHRALLERSKCNTRAKKDARAAMGAWNANAATSRVGWMTREGEEEEEEDEAPF